jgi:hypothetical protein
MLPNPRFRGWSAVQYPPAPPDGDADGIRRKGLRKLGNGRACSAKVDFTAHVSFDPSGQRQLSVHGHAYRLQLSRRKGGLPRVGGQRRLVLCRVRLGAGSMYAPSLQRVRIALSTGAVAMCPSPLCPDWLRAAQGDSPSQPSPFALSTHERSGAQSSF